MIIYDKVNTHLRTDCYRPWMVSKRRPPGSPKGQPKPIKRKLDDGFPGRLMKAMQEYEPAPLGVPELAAKVGCTRAVLLNYVNGDSKSPDPLLLLELADALRVRLPWLIAERGSMRETTNALLSPEAREIANNIDKIQDPGRRDNALKIARLATEPTVSDHKVEKAYKTSERPRITARYSKPTLFEDDMDAPEDK